MKLKIRVKKEDFMLFLLVCVILFIGCLILAANFVSFGANEQFVGLNIFKNFSMSTLGVAIVLFIISIVIIFMNVSSTIFDLEKGGLGIIFGEKEEKGYNSWMTDKEMKNARNIVKVALTAEHAEGGGLPLINDGKNMWVDNGENHTLVIGQSGSGKTTALVDPQVRSLMKHDESMVIADLKGEIYRDHGAELKERGYNVIIVNFRYPREGNAWNPLTIPYRMYKQGKRDKAKELLEDISANIVKGDGKNDDPFWTDSGSDYFSALALALFKDGSENEVNITSISNMASAGEVKNKTSRRTYAQEYFSLKGEESDVYQYAKGTVNAPEDTKKSILSVFLSKIRIFSTREELSEMLSYTDFNMENIGKEKTAVFMIVHDEKTTYHSLATIFIKQLYEVLIDVAHQNKDGRLKFRTNFILDEFANMPELRDVDSMVTAARSRNIRFTFIIQNFSQLDDVYGEKKAETIRSNCANMIYLLTNELRSLEEISKLCGEVKSKEKEKTVSTPLVTVTDLQKMKPNEIIAIRMRQKPFRTTLKQGFNTNWGKEYPKVFPEEREMYPVKSFNMKEYVDREQRKNTVDKINSARLGEGNEMDRLPRANRDYTFDPLAGFNPMNPMSSPSSRPMGSSPMGGTGGMFGSSSPSGPSAGFNPGIDIDALIKEIDEQIAKEEAKEKARREEYEKEKAATLAQQAEKEVKEAVAIEKPVPKAQEEPKEIVAIQPEPNKPTTENVVHENKPSEKPEQTPKVPVDNSSVVIDNNVVTDDQFFDDFFGDDDF